MLNKEQYLAVKATWKVEKEHSILEHILYNVLRGKPSDDGFIALTNPGRLYACDNNPWFSYNNAVLVLNYVLNRKRYNYDDTIKHYSSVFGIEFTEELINDVLKLIKTK